jgi:hypothetical protein
MSDSQSINISLVKVSISFNKERVFICNLTDLTLLNIFDAWWASINVGSKHPIAWKRSRHAPSWRFYLHCGIEMTCSPGIIGIICHQVLWHPSEHGTSSMGTHLLAKGHIAKFNKLTESEVSELTSTTIGETALAILKRQGSRGITIVRMQKKFIFYSLVVPMLTSLTDTILKTGSKGLPNCGISPRHLESLPHARICFSSHFLGRYLKPGAMTTK